MLEYCHQGQCILSHYAQHDTGNSNIKRAQVRSTVGRYGTVQCVQYVQYVQIVRYVQFVQYVQIAW